ncbi:MAG: hypothetical protein K0S22_1741 [Oscillospiraceae bacterium]|nr:hypothetical protein [Oscillospiraceae bacterium]
MFVNGKNITTITLLNSKRFQKAHVHFLIGNLQELLHHYNLSDLTVTAGVGIIKKLGKTISKKTILEVDGNYITKSIFQQGCGFEDVRDPTIKILINKDQI